MLCSVSYGVWRRAFWQIKWLAYITLSYASLCDNGHIIYMKSRRPTRRDDFVANGLSQGVGIGGWGLWLFHSSWGGWCHRSYCLRGCEWFAKCFSLHSYNQLFMSNLFAKVLPFICYCCCEDNTKGISTSDLGSRESHAIYVEPFKSGVGNYRRIYR